MVSPVRRTELRAAQFALGRMYYDGTGVRQSDKNAAQWYERAAEQSHPVAQNNLGLMYFEGRGVGQDYDQVARIIATRR